MTTPMPGWYSHEEQDAVGDLSLEVGVEVHFDARLHPFTDDTRVLPEYRPATPKRENAVLDLQSPLHPERRIVDVRVEVTSSLAGQAGGVEDFHDESEGYPLRASRGCFAPWLPPPVVRRLDDQRSCCV